MSKVELIATAAQLYNGAPLLPGQPFEANNEDDASELCVIGFAKRAPATYETRDMAATPVAAQVNAPVERVKRQYNRRDITAAR